MILNDSEWFSKSLTDPQWPSNDCYDFQRFTMIPNHDSQWFTKMIRNRCYCFSIIHNECQMTRNDFQCFSTILNDARWFSMLVNESQWWISIILKDSQRCLKILNAFKGAQWFSAFLNDSQWWPSWFSMILNGWPRYWKSYNSWREFKFMNHWESSKSFGINKNHHCEPLTIIENRSEPFRAIGDGCE